MGVVQIICHVDLTSGLSPLLPPFRGSTLVRHGMGRRQVAFFGEKIELINAESDLYIGYTTGRCGHVLGD